MRRARRIASFATSRIGGAASRGMGWRIMPSRSATAATSSDRVVALRPSRIVVAGGAGRRRRRKRFRRRHGSITASTVPPTSSFRK